ncbi:hypothetical protein [Thalassomonas actiniarum]|uniref:Uncharacterized protein n=1 Tax=Thalassomonas actiniarum TaxID=485447 RepID=A0AAE9YW35_9GAMM|nr:hypothetical protein [Thalassomonas actiniarum]WDE02351.1 hypothetical protein SG35_031875 [Thalassomonas actiniarum]
MSFDISILGLLWTLSRVDRIVIYGKTDEEKAGGGQASISAEKALDFSLFDFTVDAPTFYKKTYSLTFPQKIYQ